MQWTQWLAVSHGGYFLVTGLWPLVHLPSFEAITGAKVDKWLVRMVGALAVAVGRPLLRAGLDSSLPAVVRQIAVLSAAAFAGVDVVYVARRRIRPIYLADAGVEVVFILAWLLA